MCSRRAVDLAYRHLAEGAHQAALPFGWQRLPDRTGQPIAHRVIQASAPPRIALGGRISGLRRILSNYQRYLVWDIEAGLRDTKDLRFGMGMSAVHVSTPERRDRLWLINALAVVLLTLLGAASEAAHVYQQHQDDQARIWAGAAALAAAGSASAIRPRASSSCAAETNQAS